MKSLCVKLAGAGGIRQSDDSKRGIPQRSDYTGYQIIKLDF